MPKFPESPTAHRYLDGLIGIEIGGSAHNDFNLTPRPLNVDYTDDHTAYKQSEIDLCGETLPVDVVAEGDQLPFADSSFDYVLASHVLEHLPDAIRALAEWARVVKSGGLLYVVIPVREKSPDDVRREYTTVEHCLDDYARGETVETHPNEEARGPRGHYHIWSFDGFRQFVWHVFHGYRVYVRGPRMRSILFPRLEIIESQEFDEKVGNGHVYIMRVHK